jgi:hypothetical protein
MTLPPDDQNSKPDNSQRVPRAPSRASTDDRNRGFYGENIDAMSPQEKGLLLRRYVEEGKPLAVSIPAVYYPPAHLREHE